jgi:F-type H+-transporting ATPase subunit epsilon
MNLQLVALAGVKYSEDAYSITLPTAAGEITVFPKHEPLISVLKPGVITIRKQKNDPDQLLEHFATYGGVLEITHEGVTVLVDEADAGDEINEQEAEKARAAAETMLKNAKNQVELEHAQGAIDRQSVRLHVAQLRRRHTRR